MYRLAARRRALGERGYVAAELALGVGLLVFPVALLVLTLPTWSERQSAGRAIAREAARSLAVSGRCDPRTARDVGETMAANLGLRDGAVAVRVDCAAGSRLPRGGTVTVDVEVTMPAVRIPGVTSVGEWTWTATHSEPVDRYRSF